MTQPWRAELGRVLLLIGRLVLAGIFLYAGYSKLKPPAGMHWSLGSINIGLSMFALQVDSYQMLSPAGVTFVAHWLPPFEVFLGLWLLSGIALRISSTVTMLQLIALSAVLLRAYRLHLGINCGCFSTPEQLGPLRLLQEGLFDALGLGVMIGAFLTHRKPRGPRFEAQESDNSPAGLSNASHGI